MFSVVVPLFNKAPYIESCIDSVLRQNFPATEIIVVDDGSTDNSVELLQNRFGSKIQLIRQRNAGVSAARNAGIAAAQYEYVCLLDADDQWEADYLEEMRRLILSHGDCVFYGCGYWFEDVKHGKLFVPTRLPENFIGKLNFLEAFPEGHGIICSSSVCVRKSVISETGGFPVGKISGEDIHLWLRLGLRGPFGFNAKMVARIRRDETVDSFVNRMNVLPCHLEWMSEQLDRELPELQIRALRRLLRKHIVVNGLLAVEHHRKALLKPMINIALKQDFLLVLVLGTFYFLPSVSVSWLRKLVASMRRRS